MLLLTVSEFIQFMSTLSTLFGVIVSAELFSGSQQHSNQQPRTNGGRAANAIPIATKRLPHLQRHHRRHAAHMSLSAQELQHRRRYCNLDTCQDYAFQIWQKFEMQEEPVLRIFKQLGYDLFRSPEYKSNFCRIFMDLQRQCLSLHCDEAALSQKSPQVWSFHARAAERGFHPKYGPSSTLEHSIIEGVPDFYMEPALLKTVCESDWVPTFPTEQWCPNSTHGARSYPLFLEWILSNNLTEIRTCADVEWRVNMLSKLLYTYCDNFVDVSNFYCKYHGELIRIYTGINCTASLNCSADMVINATIPPRVLCEWDMDASGTDDGNRETACGEAGRIIESGEMFGGREDGTHAQYDPDEQQTRVFTLLPPPETPRKTPVSAGLRMKMNASLPFVYCLLLLSFCGLFTGGC